MRSFIALVCIALPTAFLSPTAFCEDEIPYDKFLKDVLVHMSEPLAYECEFKISENRLVSVNDDGKVATLGLRFNIEGQAKADDLAGVYYAEAIYIPIESFGASKYESDMASAALQRRKFPLQELKTEEARFVCFPDTGSVTNAAAFSPEKEIFLLFNIRSLAAR